eukprot:scaffold32953_cov112-Isochrysis_galbana.AAC.3
MLTRWGAPRAPEATRPTGSTWAAGRLGPAPAPSAPPSRRARSGTRRVNNGSTRAARGRPRFLRSNRRAGRGRGG